MKRIRLQEERSLLVARPDDVAGVGHLIGYHSPSSTADTDACSAAHPGRTPSVYAQLPTRAESGLL
jgi:hypothetical protein